MRAVLLGLLAAALYGQDSFEIQVYEYETVPKGMWNLETHLNYIAKGTTAPEGTTAPTNNQIHLTYELTAGVTNYFEMAGYLVAARPVGGNFFDFAGWRLRPRLRLPENWLPVKVSISGEVGFPDHKYEEDKTTLEIRPIVEKNLGRWQFDVNPVIARALRGPGKSEGWEFEPCLRIAFKATSRFEPSFEYYGSTGPLRSPFQLDEQAHILYPGADIQLNENIVWNVGVGVAATPAGNKLTYKMRLGWMFGTRK